MKEQQRGSHDPLIVNPREFLTKPFTRLEVGELTSPPDIDLLRWLPTIPEESGLVYQKPRWFVIKASSLGIPSWIMPNSSDILLHSHPIDEDEEENDGSFPSLGDFLNCSKTARELIISVKGITQYWPVEGEGQRRKLEANLFTFTKGTKKHYVRFLEEIGARFILYNWEQLKKEPTTFKALLT